MITGAYMVTETCTPGEVPEFLGLDAETKAAVKYLRSLADRLEAYEIDLVDQRLWSGMIENDVNDGKWRTYRPTGEDHYHIVVRRPAPIVHIQNYQQDDAACTASDTNHGSNE